MFFEIAGTKFGVRFGRNGTTTFATLVEITDEGIKPTGFVGIARLHPGDKFSKPMGRIVALDRLLHQLSDSNRPLPFPALTRQERLDIWADYQATQE